MGIKAGCIPTSWNAYDPLSNLKPDFESFKTDKSSFSYFNPVNLCPGRTLPAPGEKIIHRIWFTFGFNINFISGHVFYKSTDPGGFGCFPRGIAESNPLYSPMNGNAVSLSYCQVLSNIDFLSILVPPRNQLTGIKLLLIQ
jgi:hypothetical protein